MRLYIFVLILLSGPTSSLIAQIPRSVDEIQVDYDPRAAGLETKLVREWEQDGIVYRYVTFDIATFKEAPARMAAFYAFPKGEEHLPGLLHIHGGGQRAFLHEVEYYAKRGYACLSVNWGGREMEGAQPGDENTDWGNVDPTQQNVPGYGNLLPGEKFLDPVESPRNNNWYLLTWGCRRGLTFLEQQPEVDPDRLGVYGHSMGGNLTIYVAGTDHRVKVAAPSVGGSGFRTKPFPFVPEQTIQRVNGDVNLFDATIGFESYAPHIKAPTLWLSATNDFHGIMDDVYRTSALIPSADVRFAFTPHMNHRFTPEFAIARPLWIDQHLKGSFTFPETPATKLHLERIPKFVVTPDASHPIEHVQIMYSIDPDPQARFWRTARATQHGDDWTASLPVMSVDQPLFAFANVYYKLSQPEPMIQSQEPATSFAISSLLHTAAADELRHAKVAGGDQRSNVLDDFSRGWEDWYILSGNNPHHWEYSTRKVNDPKWRGEAGDKLAIELQSAEANELVLILTTNFFRPYRGKATEYLAVVPLAGGNQKERHSLSAMDFRSATGEALSSWNEIDLLSLRAYFEKDGQRWGGKTWKGSQPVFHQLSWE